MDQRTKEFTDKAEKWLRWADTALLELQEYGEAMDVDSVERVFIGLLSNITTVHESLSAAAICAGRKEWAQALDKKRNSDQLLLYMWKARDVETHDALVKWSPNMHRLGVRVVDQQAAFQTGSMFFQDRSQAAVLLRLIRYIYEASDDRSLTERMENRFRPSAERLERAGVAIRFAQSLSLQDFWYRNKGKRMLVKHPIRHLGRPLEPSAHQAAKSAVTYYLNTFTELTLLLGRPVALELRSLQADQP